MRIKAITFEHGKNDFEFWHNFKLSQEDEKIILDTLSKYINDGESIRGTNNHRICSACGKIMTEGYCVDDGLEYFCCDGCLHTRYSEEEYDEMFENDVAYWTEWED